MNIAIHVNAADVSPEHKMEHEKYEYMRRILLPKGAAEQCAVALYEVPPGKAAYPYHYHTKNEETFYIISGEGLLRTPEGERPVKPGDFLYFPANESGAHKLTNSSQSETLVYLDFDSFNDLDVALYPDSGKIGIWGKNINQIYETKDSVDYYKGE